MVRAWLKQVGDRVEVNDPLVELETDKVAMEVPAPAAGVLREILLDTDAEAVPGRGARADRAGGGGRGARHVIPAKAGASAEHRAEPARPEVPASAGIDGDAPFPLRPPRPAPARHRPRPDRGHRPRRADHPRRRRPRRRGGDRRSSAKPASARPRASARGRRARPTTRSARTASRTTGCGCRIAENMLASVTRAPHVTAMFEADFSAIIAHRERHKEALAKKGVKLTYTAYIVAAAAEAMKVAPGDQQPLARGPARDFRRHQYRRRHRAGREGPDRAGAPQGADPVAEGHRRRPRRADREGEGRAAHRAATSRAAPSPSPTTASRARSSPRRSSSTSRNRRSSASASSRRGWWCAKWAEPTRS